MKLAALALLATLVSPFASAAELVYKIDFEGSKMEKSIALDLCGLPETIKMDAREDLATVVIKKTRSYGPTPLSIQYIQASEGSIDGGDLKEPYMGDYRVRVAITNLKVSDKGYPNGIYNRVEVVTYGSKAAPKAFVVYTELLNHRESAEWAEDNLCSGYAYTLQ